MHYNRIPEINKGIIKNQKVVITLGCSFVEGQGAIDQKIWDTYYKKSIGHSPYLWDFTKEQQEEICNEFPNVTKNNLVPSQLEFSRHEVDNSFGHVLCKKYFNDEYTCINLGRRGNGNRATIKDLYFYPQILWDQIKEIIVIYCPSGAERYDFIDDQATYLNNHSRWVTVWPGAFKKPPPYDENTDPQDIISYGFNKCLYTDKSVTLEQIANVQELILWCKYKKAKLIITPAFMPTYTKQQFTGYLNMDVAREPFTRKILSQKPDVLNHNEIEKIVNLWPWENMFYPNHEPTFADLAMSQEKSVDRSKCWFYNFEYTGTPDKWITPCAHPSAKAHDLFAQCLYKHIVG